MLTVTLIELYSSCPPKALHYLSDVWCATAHLTPLTPCRQGFHTVFVSHGDGREAFATQDEAVAFADDTGHTLFTEFFLDVGELQVGNPQSWHIAKA